MRKTKNNKKLTENVDTSKVYEPIDAIKILKENSFTKFVEALEVAINLGIDTNKTDQNIRGVITLPKGTGKKINIAVLAKGEKQDEKGSAVECEPVRCASSCVPALLKLDHVVFHAVYVSVTIVRRANLLGSWPLIVVFQVMN